MYFFWFIVFIAEKNMYQILFKEVSLIAETIVKSQLLVKL